MVLSKHGFMYRLFVVLKRWRYSGTDWYQNCKGVTRFELHQLFHLLRISSRIWILLLKIFSVLAHLFFASIGLLLPWRQFFQKERRKSSWAVRIRQKRLFPYSLWRYWPCLVSLSHFSAGNRGIATDSSRIWNSLWWHARPSFFYRI